MKKGFSLLLALALCATISSCAKEKKEFTDGSKADVSTTANETDKSQSSETETDKNQSDEMGTVSKADGPVSIDNWVTEVTATHYATISIENYGDITIALDGKTAPITVNNFVKLAESGFYNGLTFHRIIKGFMMQGGDPLGNGTGGSNEKIQGEFAENGYYNNISHVRGAISMARGTQFDSGRSQFFIVHKDSTYLNEQYAAFGFVTKGMDVVDAVCEAARPIDRNGTIPAENQPVIKSITITKV